MYTCTSPNRRVGLFHIDFKSKVLNMGAFHPPAHVFYLHQICAMSHVAKNKVKGSFYCTRYFLLFVLVSFMGLFRIPNNRSSRVPRFFPIEQISLADRYFLQQWRLRLRTFSITLIINLLTSVKLVRAMTV